MSLFDTESRTERRVVLALLVVGLVLRLALVAVAFESAYNPNLRLKGDTEKYLAIGISLSRGEGFSMHYRSVLSEFFQGQPVSPPPPVPTAARSPGYPLFLALVFSTLGYHLGTVALLQVLLSTLTALFVYLTARELKAVPVLALSFAVFYYPFAFDAIYVMSECLFTFCTAALLWLLVRPRSEFVGGLVAGAAVLVKPVILPFLLPASAMKGRRGWILVTLMACAIGPWSCRNYRHTGVPYVTLSCAGYPFFLLHNQRNGGFPLMNRPGDLNESYPGFQLAVAQVKLRAPNVADPVAREYLEDGELLKEALRFIRSDPSQALRAVRQSFANTWRIDYPTANWVRWLNNVVLYAGLLPFVLWGSIHALRYGPAGARLLVFFLLYFIGVHSVLASEIRYRIAAMPAYFVLAAVGLAAIGESRQLGKRIHFTRQPET